MRDYSFKQFQADAIAGVIVGIVALPLSIAFGIACGVSPEKGLMTAIVAGFLISALGGSRVQIGGPTGAFVVIVYTIVQEHGLDGLIVATFIAGLILIILGLSRFGGAIRYIPYPVTVGFTSGIAVLIASAQLNDFLGLGITSVPAEFFEKWSAYFEARNHVNPYALGIATATIAITLLWRRVSRTVPGSLIAIVAATVMVAVFDFPVQTIGDKYGEISRSIPMPVLPHFDLAIVRDVMPSAITIAVLAGIESLLSAVVSDGMIGGKHRSNTELIAQGIANCASALFGGIPATGAIARTATNVQSGGRTPIAGMVHAVVLLGIMYLFSNWVAYVPLACLAGILAVVAYHMSEWRSFVMILNSPKSDVSVLLITFALTVVFDLVIAIQFGVVLSALLLIHRLSMSPNIDNITREISRPDENGDLLELGKKDIPKGVEVFEIVGAFFFGVAAMFVQTMNDLATNPTIRILRMRNVMSIDATALNALRSVVRNSSKHHVTILLSGLHDQPLKALVRSGLYDEIGEENILPTIDDALERARKLMGQDTR